jgi:ubiquinone biosynthesis protein
LPPDLALFIKAFISLEGMGRELDPELDLAGEAIPMLREALLVRYAPAAMAKRGWHAASEISKLMTDLPRDLSQLLRAARRGRLELHIDVGHLKHVGDQLDGATNRLIVGIIVASIIVGSSVVMTVSGGPTLFGLPFFGLLGFIFATIGGIWLILSISRSNKAERESRERKS